MADDADKTQDRMEAELALVVNNRRVLPSEDPTGVSKGICKVCNSKIPQGRMDLFPNCNICVTCLQLDEQKSKINQYVSY